MIHYKTITILLLLTMNRRGAQCEFHLFSKEMCGKAILSVSEFLLAKLQAHLADSHSILIKLL